MWCLRLCVAKDIYVSGGPIWCGRDTSEPASWLRPSYLAHMSATKGRFSFQPCRWRCWAMWTLWWNIASKLNLLICFWLLRLAGQILIVLPLSKVQHKCISCLLSPFHHRWEISSNRTIISNRRWHLGQHHGYHHRTDQDMHLMGHYGWASGWGALEPGSRLRPKTLQVTHHHHHHCYHPHSLWWSS